jgi:hypothetical protein
VQFGLESIARAAKFGNGLFGEELLQSPLFNVLRFILLELSDELDGTLENASLVLFTAGNNFGKFIDAFVDCLAASAFNCKVMSDGARSKSSGSREKF